MRKTINESDSFWGNGPRSGGYSPISTQLARRKFPVERYLTHKENPSKQQKKSKLEE